MIFLDKFTHRTEVAAHVFIFEWNASLREVGFCRVARRSSRLAEEDHAFAVHMAMRLSDDTKGGTNRLEIRKLRNHQAPPKSPFLDLWGGADHPCWTAIAPRYSISKCILAVFCSMAETEQYFSFESRTASSTAFFCTLPPTA